MAEMCVRRIGGDAPVRFAARELAAGLRAATGVAVPVRAARRHDPDRGGLWLGTFGDLGLGPDDAADAIAIDVGAAGGTIAGANPRSVLLAAYRFLHELGFRWVRPGRDGRVVPGIGRAPLRRVRVREAADHGHRVVCIEGACSWEHVRDMVDWLPKLGFNGYFVQFRDGFNFFDRWYRHEGNPRRKARPFAPFDAEALTRRIWSECRKRGLMIQMAGHGWTCDPFGVPGRGWYVHPGRVPARIRPHLAEVGGERAFWGGVALNTNLCYGNPATRRTVRDAVVAYAADHPEIDAVHLWLADGSNNHCECARCRGQRPSDLYVRLLNEVDAELTRRGVSTRIVFLVYVDLLWPPVTQRLRNADRFILMFAPITRTYSRSFLGVKPARKPLPRYRRNRLAMPTRIEENIAFLRAWQRRFKGDSFDFDYHLMWDHYRDPGHWSLARVLHEDVRALKDIGLNGLNSCQVQRVFLPSGLLMTVMGRTLWNRGLSFDRIATDHLKAAFGPQWTRARRYMQQLSEAFDPPLLRGERVGPERAESVRKLARVPSIVDRFSSVITANAGLDDRCQAQSWAYLRTHGELCLGLAAVLVAWAREHEADARAAMRALARTARRLESRIHPVFDVCVFLNTIGGLVPGWEAEDA